MKREHFELLWNSCAGQKIGYLSAKEKSSIHLDVWSNWKKKNLVGEGIVPAKAFFEEYNLHEPATIRRIEDSNECWILPQEPESGGKFKLPISEVEQFPVYLEHLANHIAEEWGIEPAFMDVTPGGCRIGIVDQETPLVILHEVLENPFVQVRSCKEILGTPKLFILCINETHLSNNDKLILDEHRIIFLSTGEFITTDGNPRWGIEYLPKLKLMPAGTPWSYDPDTDIVEFDNTQLNLKPSGKKLIVKLLHHFGKIVPIEELLEALYGNTNDGTFTYGDHHLKDRIYHLRKSLPPEAKLWLKNFPKKGYGLFPPS